MGCGVHKRPWPGSALQLAIHCGHFLPADIQIASFNNHSDLKPKPDQIGDDLCIAAIHSTLHASPSPSLRQLRDAALLTRSTVRDLSIVQHAKDTPCSVRQMSLSQDQVRYQCKRFALHQLRVYRGRMHHLPTKKNSVRGSFTLCPDTLSPDLAN